MNVTFYPVIPGIYTAQKADKSALGTLPTRGFRFCEPLRLASGFGWYGYPPANLAIQWDGGHQMDVWCEGTALPLPPGSALQFPGLHERWNAAAPAELMDQSYPMILRPVHEPAMVQIWTGCLVRTPPEWAVVIRPVVNVPPPFGFTVYEGIIETDQWFGPLFSNIVLTKTDVRIDLPKGRPLFQLQPVSREALAASAAILAFGDDWTETDWNDYNATVVKPNRDVHRPRGQYAMHSRQRPNPPTA